MRATRCASLCFCRIVCDMLLVYPGRLYPSLPRLSRRTRRLPPCFEELNRLTTDRLPHAIGRSRAECDHSSEIGVARLLPLLSSRFNGRTGNVPQRRRRPPGISRSRQRRSRHGWNRPRECRAGRCGGHARTVRGHAGRRHADPTHPPETSRKFRRSCPSRGNFGRSNSCPR